MLATESPTVYFFLSQGRPGADYVRMPTEIIARKKERIYIRMLSIYIGSFDCKTSYKYFLP